jgi:hypothetical protein
VEVVDQVDPQLEVMQDQEVVLTVVMVEVVV